MHVRRERKEIVLQRLAEITDTRQHQAVFDILRVQPGPDVAHIALGPFSKDPQEGRFSTEDCAWFLDRVFSNPELLKAAVTMGRLGYDAESKGPALQQHATKENKALETTKSAVTVKHADMAPFLQKLVPCETDDDMFIVFRYDISKLSPRLVLWMQKVKKEPWRVLYQGRFINSVKPVVAEIEAVKDVDETTRIVCDIALKIVTDPTTDPLYVPKQAIARENFLKEVKTVLQEKSVMANDAQKIADCACDTAFTMGKELMANEDAWKGPLKQNESLVGGRDALTAKLNPASSNSRSAKPALGPRKKGVPSKKDAAVKMKATVSMKKSMVPGSGPRGKRVPSKKDAAVKMKATVSMKESNVPGSGPPERKSLEEQWTWSKVLKTMPNTHGPGLLDKVDAVGERVWPDLYAEYVQNQT